jgi:hypothetical protein
MSVLGEVAETLNLRQGGTISYPMLRATVALDPTWKRCEMTSPRKARRRSTASSTRSLKLSTDELRHRRWSARARMLPRTSAVSTRTTRRCSIARLNVALRSPGCCMAPEISTFCREVSLDRPLKGNLSCSPACRLPGGELMDRNRQAQPTRREVLRAALAMSAGFILTSSLRGTIDDTAPEASAGQPEWSLPLWH